LQPFPRLGQRPVRSLTAPECSPKFGVSPLPLISAKVVIGFVVGVLIGMSGVGGGVLLLPVLIFGLRVPAIVAVGSDALFNFFTKVPASLMHLVKGTVRWKVVIALAVGSVPGSIAGVKLLMYIRFLYGDGVNNFIKSAVGVLLIVIPLLLLFQRRIEERVANRPRTLKSFAGVAVIGLIAGSLVGMTSVESGSIIMMLLLLLCSFPPKVLVGTDIAHAVVLTRRDRLSSFSIRQCGSRFGSLAAARFDPWRSAGIVLGHARSHALAAPYSVRAAGDHRSLHAVAAVS
jgi:uncharacterized protein